MTLRDRLLAHLRRLAAEPGWPVRAHDPAVTVRPGRVTLRAVAHAPHVTLTEADAEALAAWLDEGHARGWWPLMLRLAAARRHPQGPPHEHP